MRAHRGGACALVENDIDSPLSSTGNLRFSRLRGNAQASHLGRGRLHRRRRDRSRARRCLFPESCSRLDSGNDFRSKRCTTLQIESLKLRINRGGSPEPPRHEDYVTLNHFRGGVCSFSRRQTRIWIFAPDGPGEGGVLKVGPGSDLSGAYGPSLGGQLFRFRFSSGCRQTGPFVARVLRGQPEDPGLPLWNAGTEAVRETLVRWSKQA